MGPTPHLSPLATKGGVAATFSPSSTDIAPSCGPGTLLPPAGHTASSLEGEPSGSEGPRQAVLGLREPPGRECPSRQRNQGIVTNLIKFAL